MASRARLLRFPIIGVLLVADVAAAQQPDPDTEVARRHFDAGTRYYDRGDYAAALDEFVAARFVKPSAALDYDIARCADRLERYRVAIEAYKRFAAATTDQVAAREVRARIAVLKARIARVLRGRKKRLVATPPRTATHAATAWRAAGPLAPGGDARPPPPGSASTPPRGAQAASPSAAIAALRPRPALAVPAAATPAGPASPRLRLGSRWTIGQVVAGGAAIVALGVGGALQGTAGATFGNLRDGCAPACDPTAWEGARGEEQAGTALLVTGGLLLAADGVLLLVRWKLPSLFERPRVVLAPTAGGVLASGTF